MQTKITGWSVVREAVALMWRRRLAVLGFLVVQIIFSMAYGLLGLGDAEVVRSNLDTVNAGVVAVGTLIFVVLGSAIYLLYMHYMLTALRGEPVLVPARPVRRLLRMIWTGFKVCLVFMLLMGLISMPIIGLAVSVPGLKDNAGAVLAVGVGGFVLMFFLFVVFLRLELAVPGVIAGDGTTLRAAWRMTRGRGGRMLASMIWLALLCFVMAFVVALPVFLIAGSAQGPVFVQAAALSNAIPTLLGAAVFCVWYVRLADGESGGDLAERPGEPDRDAPRVENLAEKIGEGYYGGAPRD